MNREICIVSGFTRRRNNYDVELGCVPLNAVRKHMELRGRQKITRQFARENWERTGWCLKIKWLRKPRDFPFFYSSNTQHRRRLSGLASCQDQLIHSRHLRLHQCWFYRLHLMVAGWLMLDRGFSSQTSSFDFDELRKIKFSRLSSRSRLTIEGKLNEN